MLFSMLCFRYCYLVVLYFFVFVHVNVIDNVICVFIVIGQCYVFLFSCMLMLLGRRRDGQNDSTA